MKVTKITGPLSYEVTTESGMTLQRHVDHLRRFLEESQTTLSTQEDWSIIDTTPQGRPQPNQVEVSEAEEDRVEQTEPTQSTPENPTPVVRSPVRRSNRKRKPHETFAPFIRNLKNLKRGKCGNLNKPMM